ncbi:hypothetical protein R3W88_016905 [Solanum pinnatisectum]|uniref:Uncharacterized protein n=1 Tax=Solanum pinnatisectum TaxID=50273 RepID=A0AAV9KYN9_9SOLN|nr:hypothetical protein R3W88_016905 [Solanum pinnatisectum]
MKNLKKTNLLVFLTLIVLIMFFQPGKGTRLLHEKDLMNLQSLQRGPVPSSGPSGCTNIPGNSGSGSGNCPLINEMHFAGHMLRPSTVIIVV